MKKLFFALFCLILLSSHDLYLKTDHYFMKPDQPGELYLFNGTIDKSENSIDRDRMIGSKIVGPNYDFQPEDMDWYDKNNATFLAFKTGASGTYAAGVTTKPKALELTAEEFNEYLEHDGVLDVLESRKINGKLNNVAVEKYAKHVKVLFQVGNTHSDHYKTNFGYPLEFIPLENPYRTEVNDELLFELRKNNKPLKDHLVYFGFEGESSHKADDHQTDEEHQHDERSARTDESGRFTVKIDHSGAWFIRTINMVESSEEGIDYESNWATLTFEIK